MPLLFGLPFDFFSPFVPGPFLWGTVLVVVVEEEDTAGVTGM
jgi:hypothetical protein